MSAFFQLTIAQLRIFIRNKQALIWMLLFPFFFMFIFGIFLDNDKPTTYRISVIDQDQSELSKSIIKGLTKQEIFENEPSPSIVAGKQKLKNAKIDLLIVFPNNFAQQVAKKQQSPGLVDVYFNDKNLTQARTALAVMESVIDGVSKKMTHYQPVIQTNQLEVSGLSLKYLDFLVPGIIAMQIMTMNMNGVAGQIASWRERGVLRRMQGTMLKASTFIAAQITARLVLNGLQALLLLLVAYFAFDVKIQGSIFGVILFILLGTLTFMSIGFIIAGLAKTPESAGPIAGFLSFPLLFLGGVFFPISNMPEYLQPIVKGIPISQLSNALREIMNVGTPLTGLLPEFAWLCGWLVVGFVVATRVFKWE